MLKNRVWKPSLRFTDWWGTSCCGLGQLHNFRMILRRISIPIDKGCMNFLLVHWQQLDQGIGISFLGRNGCQGMETEFMSLVSGNFEVTQEKFWTSITAIFGAQIALRKHQYKLHELEQIFTVAVFIVPQKTLCQLHVATDFAPIDGHLVHLFVHGLDKEARGCIKKLLLNGTQGMIKLKLRARSCGNWTTVWARHLLTWTWHSWPRNVGRRVTGRVVGLSTMCTTTGSLLI